MQRRANSGPGDAMPRKELKTGVRRGGGPPPGYRWNVVIPDLVFDEAMGFLNSDQYEHLAHQFRELAREPIPTHSRMHSIDAVEDFHELRDKGGILGSLNVRVFFFLDKDDASIVVLGAIHKQNDGPTPRADKIRVSRRKRLYLDGRKPRER
jgi:hypothetical protein